MLNILKWYKILDFPEEWDESVKAAAEKYVAKDADGSPMSKLLWLLNKCEALSEEYEKLGIDCDVLLETLSDIVIWAKNCYLNTGEIGIVETGWLSSHVNMKIFRLGRLQFRFGNTLTDCARLGLSCGEPILEIHIPQGEPVKPELVRDSCTRAVSFFAKYFPEYKYRFFTCDSWLLDFNFERFLKPESNILRFQREFDIIMYKESASALRYLFTLNPDKEHESSLQRSVKQLLDGGGKLFEGYGLIDAKKYGKEI